MPINSFSPPRIVIDTNSPAHAESSPHVRRTLDINRESDIHAVAGTLQTPISIHALRKESDPGTLRLTKRSKNFNPHSPCGERRHQHLQRARTQDFNPHSPCGERPPPWPSRHAPYDFNPHSPCGERRGLQDAFGFVHGISIHTPLAGSDETRMGVQQSRNISIHTPRAGSDIRRSRSISPKPISIHTPLAGSDLVSSLPSFELVQFQSTLPLRGATKNSSPPLTLTLFQSTLPLRGATYRLGRVPYPPRISIHTPLAGSDGAAPR